MYVCKLYILSAYLLKEREVL